MDITDSNNIANALKRKEFIKVMKESEYGWKSFAGHSSVGCPTDLHYISKKDLPHPYNCIMQCKECWKYVLKNKKW